MWQQYKFLFFQRSAHRIRIYYLQEDGDDRSHSSAMDISDLGGTTVVGAEATSEVESVS